MKMLNKSCNVKEENRPWTCHFGLIQIGFLLATNQSTNSQPLNMSTNQTFDQSTNQPANQTTNQPNESLHAFMLLFLDIALST